MAVPRAANAENSCVVCVFWCSLGSEWHGWGDSREPCASPRCSGHCAWDWLQVWASCERICGCERHKRLGLWVGGC